MKNIGFVKDIHFKFQQANIFWIIRQKIFSSKLSWFKMQNIYTFLGTKITPIANKPLEGAS